MNKSIFFFFIFFIIGSCDYNRVGEDEPTFVKKEYNPQKAGAEIVQRINCPAGYGVLYSNQLLYIVGSNDICICDLSEDIAVKKKLPCDIEWLCSDYDYISRCSGITVQNQNITFMVEISNGRKDTKVILDINEGEQKVNYSDISADIQHKVPIDEYYSYCALQDFYCDLSNDTMYVGYRYDIINNSYKYRYNIYKYEYNTVLMQYEPSEMVLAAEEKDKYDMYLSNDYFVLGNYTYYPNGDMKNTLLVYSKSNPSEYAEIDLVYLHITNRPLSAFSDDDGNIWLYVKEYDSETEQDKYELLKLKLL